MPEHFHFMISEPEKGDPSVVMKVLKQTVTRRLLPQGSDHFWQKRFYDFNVFSEEKFIEKLLRNAVR
jgi:putative transposase